MKTFQKTFFVCERDQFGKSDNQNAEQHCEFSDTWGWKDACSHAGTEWFEGEDVKVCRCAEAQGVVK